MPIDIYLILVLLRDMLAIVSSSWNYGLKDGQPHPKAKERVYPNLILPVMKGRKLYKLMKYMPRFTTGTSNSIGAILNGKTHKLIEDIIFIKSLTLFSNVL